jgi:DENN domain-containing protein 1
MYFPFKLFIFRTTSPLSFSFVLTNDQQYKFGYCRREITSGSTNIACKSQVILSSWPWHDIFLKFLNILADLRKKVSDKQFDNYLNLVYAKKIPDEHNTINLTFSDVNGIILFEFIFRRPLSRLLPSIPENHNLNLFYNFFEPKVMIEIFAALFAERRIIFKSTNLDKLSSCLQAACSLLFPMHWQHIFIPLLPLKLKDYLSAPMP